MRILVYYTLCLIVHTSLDLCDIDRVLLELRKNSCHSILEPESIPLELDTFDETFVVLDSMSDFSARLCAFAVNCIDHVMGTFVAKSHKKRRL